MTVISRNEGDVLHKDDRVDDIDHNLFIKV